MTPPTFAVRGEVLYHSSVPLFLIPSNRSTSQKKQDEAKDAHDQNRRRHEHGF
jgi:hypothetical protein